MSLEIDLLGRFAVRRTGAPVPTSSVVPRDGGVPPW
jgi:hypothetical protein